MSRDPSGIYTVPAGTDGIPDTTIESAKYNGFVHDVEQDLNIARPIVAGGTGATSASQARTNIGAEVSVPGQTVTNYNSHVYENGSFSSAPGATGAPLGNTTDYFFGTVWTDGNVILVEARNLTTGVHYAREKVGASAWTSWEVHGGTGQFVLKAGDTMTGHLSLPTGPAAANAVRKDYVDTQDALKVNKAGDTMTGKFFPKPVTTGWGIAGVMDNLEIQSSGSTVPAAFTFHIPSSFQSNFGLGVDGNFYMAGGSLGNGVAYKFWTDREAARNLAAVGYQKLPSGLIIQWGAIQTGTGDGTVTFGTAFPSNVFCVVANGTTNPLPTTQMSSIHIAGTTLTQFTINARYAATGGAVGPLTNPLWMYWLALGQ